MYDTRTEYCLRGCATGTEIPQERVSCAWGCLGMTSARQGQSWKTFQVGFPSLIIICMISKNLATKKKHEQPS